MATYAVGDIHGRYDVLKSLIDKLNLTPDDHVVFLGDYVDRGPDWFSVIKFIDDLKKVCKVTALLGNHELMMMDCIQRLIQLKDSKDRDRDRGIIDNWMLNGGDVTLAGFRKLSNEDKQFAIKFLYDLQVDITIDANGDSYTLCHALPGDVGATKFDAVWGRLEFDHEDNIYYEANIDTNTLMDKYANKIIIHGHTPVMAYTAPNTDLKPVLYKIRDVKFIDIDLGCAYIGKTPKANLCAFRLDDEEEFYAI